MSEACWEGTVQAPKSSPYSSLPAAAAAAVAASAAPAWKKRLSLLVTNSNFDIFSSGETFLVVEFFLTEKHEESLSVLHYRNSCDFTANEIQRDSKRWCHYFSSNGQLLCIKTLFPLTSPRLLSLLNSIQNKVLQKNCSLLCGRSHYCDDYF